MTSCCCYRIVRARCIGLDPAGPAFDGGPDDMRFTSDDCRVVTAIHSSSASTKLLPLNLALNVQLGTYYKTGHCDYWVNCGHMQGLCEADIDFEGVLNALKGMSQGSDSQTAQYIAGKVCNHMRAPLVLSSSVNGKCDYKTESCTKCGEGVLDCEGGGLGTGLPFPNATTIACDPSKGNKQNFILRTTNTADYCNP